MMIILLTEILHSKHSKMSKTKINTPGKSNAPQGKSGEQTVQFKDNRPETIQQLKQQELADKYSESKSNPVQRKKNTTGIPDNLKQGIEQLSGHSMDDVKVHYNSNKPSQLHAHAYAQGTNIHIASGQEKHLPHEAWHVAQQKQGRVKPTTQVKGKKVNDDKGLEREADVMGAKANRIKSSAKVSTHQSSSGGSTIQQTQKPPIQLALKIGKMTLSKVTTSSTGLQKALREKGVSNKADVIELLNDLAENASKSFSSWDAAIQWAIKKIKADEEKERIRKQKREARRKKREKASGPKTRSESPEKEKEEDDMPVRRKKKKPKIPVFKASKANIDFAAGESEPNRKDVMEQLEEHFEGELKPSEMLVDQVLKLLLQIPDAKGSEANEKSSKGHISQEPKILAQISLLVMDIEKSRLYKKFDKKKVRKKKKHLFFKSTEKGDTHGTQEQ